jgi:hypothetical protein
MHGCAANAALPCEKERYTPRYRLREKAMDEIYWQRMARVYRAGAEAQRGYRFNMERQQQAEALEAMARECDAIAADCAK